MKCKNCGGDLVEVLMDGQATGIYLCWGCGGIYGSSGVICEEVKQEA